ncbi:hypothetical protein T4D_2120 [Trichinella pseudospiralis]|uniref:Uncharacterized protein n=1 Tax=Trichinella pseudospiralis TaxID=6337 RepID=A0A0V1DM79_TRIPS|nr:hypothetical protein T4D_2120 [Trichinella pseudospiralis]
MSSAKWQTCPEWRMERPKMGPTLEREAPFP